MDKDNAQSLASTAKMEPVGEGAKPPAKKPVSQVPATLQNLEVNVIPDELEITLDPPAAEQATRLRPLWHRVEQRPGALVSIWSRDDRLHVVRLSLRGQSPGWNPAWVRWVFAVRQTPHDLGGGALAAQDMLSADCTELTLLVLPGEQRSATVEIVASMDGETYPGNYTFDVVMTDVEDGAVSTAPGLLRLRHPAAEAMNYLPALYSQAPMGSTQRYAPYEDKPFLDRFLRGFEDAMQPTNRLMEQMADYFDADATPPEFLPWLGTWVALVLDENWPELKRRRLIKEAVELYRWRGTRHGLARYLEIYAGVIPQINDQPFEGMRLGRQTLLGQNTLLGDVPPHTFVVTLAVPDARAVNEQTVRDIIESEKPAHSAYELRIVARSQDEA